MTKGVQKRDGSGKGIRANRGRGGCKTTKSTGKGYNRRRRRAVSSTGRKIVNRE